MSNILVIGGGVIVAIVAYTWYESKKKDGSGAAPPTLGINNSNGGLSPPGCSPVSDSPGMWNCPSISYQGQTGIVISSFRVPAYDPPVGQISFDDGTATGNKNLYFFREWIKLPLGI